MISSQVRDSRYLTKARAAYTARLLAAGAIIAVPVACGNSDEAVFTATTAPVTAATTTVPTPTAAATAPAPAATPAPTTQAPATAAATVATQAPVAPTAAGDSAASDTVADTAAPASGSRAIAEGSQMTLDFTYTASGGGRVHSPYIAAWVEDPDGNLVQTIAVWFESGKGEKWLPDLSSWYAAASDTDVTTSGATRTPGTYSLVWDGTDWNGAAAPAGSYRVFVESAREKGPYSITSAEIALDGGATSVTLPDNGELSALTVTV